MKINFTIFLLLLFFNNYSQTKWRSNKYGYSIEIPKGFIKTISTGANVDFKANDGINSIVIVVTSIPAQYKSNSIYDLIGNMKTYGATWEVEAQEYMNNPKFLKDGKTTLSNLQTFWYDYTTEEPKLYSKTYQTKKGLKLYTITVTCLNDNYNYYSPIWYRFKEKIKF